METEAQNACEKEKDFLTFYDIFILSCFGLSLGTMNIYFSLAIFEVPFKELFSDIDQKVMMSFMTLGFCFTATFSGFIPFHDYTTHALGNLVQSVGIGLVILGFSLKIAVIIYSACAIMATGVSLNYFTAVPATILVCPKRTGSCLGWFYFGIGISFIIGPQITKLFLSLTTGEYAYGLMFLCFLVLNLIIMNFVKFCPNNSSKVSFKKLFSSRQVIGFIFRYFSVGFSSALVATFQSSFMDWFEESRDSSIDLWTLISAVSPIPRLGTGLAIDYCVCNLLPNGSVNVGVITYTFYTLCLFLFALFGDKSQIIFIISYCSYIYIMNSFAPIEVALSTLIWGIDGKKVFSGVMIAYSAGAFVSTALANHFGILKSCYIFAAFSLISTLSFPFARTKIDIVSSSST